MNTKTQRKGRVLPTRIPTAVVAQAIVDFLHTNIDPITSTVTISINDIAEGIKLDFPRVLRAKEQLVEWGILEQIKSEGKVYTYRIRATEVPSTLVFRHKKKKKEIENYKERVVNPYSSLRSQKKQALEMILVRHQEIYQQHLFGVLRELDLIEV